MVKARIKASSTKNILAQTENKPASSPKAYGYNLRAGLKVIAWIVGLAVLALVFLNWGFVKARVSYVFYKPNPASVLTPSATPPTNNTHGSWPQDTLAIPSLGIAAPVQYVTEQSEKAFQKALQDGVVHYPGSSMPGQPGNVYIFGHSSDYVWSRGKYKSIFALLPKVKTGAEIKLTDSNGYLYTYLVTNQFVVDPNNVEVLSQETHGKHLLTVQTSYPIGTALKRYVVVAELRQSD